MIEYQLETKGAELDASGTVTAAAILKYMEFSRWNMMSPKGMDIGKLLSGMVVRSQQIQIHQSLGPFEKVTVRAWLSRVGRTSMDICQAITRNKDDMLVIQGLSTMVHIDQQGRPAPLDQAVHDAVVKDAPYGPPSDFGIDNDDWEQPPASWREQRPVRASDLDSLRHMNHSKFAEYIVDARTQCTLESGYKNNPDKPIKRVKSLRIDYEAEAKLGEQMTIASWDKSGGEGYMFELSNLADPDNTKTYARGFIQLHHD